MLLMYLLLRSNEVFQTHGLPVVYKKYSFASFRKALKARQKFLWFLFHKVIFFSMWMTAWAFLFPDNTVQQGHFFLWWIHRHVTGHGTTRWPLITSGCQKLLCYQSLSEHNSYWWWWTSWGLSTLLMGYQQVPELILSYM